MQLPKPHTILLTTVTAATLAFTGCVADPEVADVLPDQGSVPTHVSEVSFPDTEVAQTSEWVVEEINGTRAINKQDWYPRVAPELTDEIPVDSLVGTLNAQLRPSLPFVPSDYEEPEADYGVTRLTPDLTAEPVDLHVRIDETGRITDLWYETIESDEEPVPQQAPLTDAPTDFEDPEDQSDPGGGLGQ